MSFTSSVAEAAHRSAVLAPETVLYIKKEVSSLFCNTKQSTYSRPAVGIAIGVEDGHDVPVNIVDVLRVSVVVLDELVDEPSDEGRGDPFTGVDAFGIEKMILKNVLKT